MTEQEKQELEEERTKRLERTGFYEWRNTQPANMAHGDIWLAGYARALEDAAKVAEAYNDNDELDVVCRLIADNIRALSE